MNLTYENSKKLDIKLNIENYSIKSCGSLPCIYEKALLEKEKILNLMKSHDKWKQLHAEFCNIFDMGKDGLITFQNKINLIGDIHLISEMNNIIGNNLSIHDLFVPSEIQYEIENQAMWRIHGNYDNIEVKFISKKRDVCIVKQLINRINTMRILCSWNKPIKLTVWDSSLKRVLNESVGRREINGGYTWRGSGEIHIFRRQEVKKVLVHELIHTFAMDYAYNVDICESYVELWATILNGIFTMIETGSPPNIDILGALLSIEAAFSLIQFKKIMKYKHLEHLPTPIKGYFFMKTNLLWNMDKLAIIFRDMDPVFRFPIRNMNIVKDYTDTKFVEDLVNNVNVPISMKKNLRMTCIEQ